MTRGTALAALGLLCLCGCAASEPYERPDAWSFTGANAANLAAMAERPADLARGRSYRGTDGSLAAAAATRLEHDKVKPLTDTASGSTTSATGGTSTGAAGTSSGPTN